MSSADRLAAEVRKALAFGSVLPAIATVPRRILEEALAEHEAEAREQITDAMIEAAAVAYFRDESYRLGTFEEQPDYEKNRCRQLARAALEAAEAAR